MIAHTSVTAPALLLVFGNRFDQVSRTLRCKAPTKTGPYMNVKYQGQRLDRRNKQAELARSLKDKRPLKDSGVMN